MEYYVKVTRKGDLTMVNFAIVGCGHIAKKHAEAISKTEGATLVAVCDTVQEPMNYYNEEYGAKTYTHLSELLEREDIHVVNICTPSGYHVNITKQIATAKKHVIVEKPIALTLEDTNEMITACHENNVKLAVVHPNRFRPVMMWLKDVMEKELLGKLSHANVTVRWNRGQAYYDQAAWRGTRALDGGVLMNQAIHSLDLLVWLMGDVTDIFSMEATRFRNIESEDVSVGVVRFASGALGVIEAATTIYPKNLEESISIFGEKGSIKVGGANAVYLEHCNIKGMSEEDVQNIAQTFKENPFGKPGHQCIIEDMILAISENREPIVTGEDGKKALELVVKMNNSAAQGEVLK